MSMAPIKRICTVDRNGNIVVTVGVEAAGADVEVIVNPLRQKEGIEQMTAQQWRDFVVRTAGSIDDPEFRRHDQGDYEDRLPLE
jgi:hypothetical protein